MAGDGFSDPNQPERPADAQPNAGGAQPNAAENTEPNASGSGRAQPASQTGESANSSERNQPGAPKTREVKTFSCPTCGASVEIKYSGLTMSVVCGSCKTILDATDPNYQIIGKFASLVTRHPLIPLGKRGKLFGKTWELIGFMVRKDNGYSWDEYLLFNPYYGYRWLTYDVGHWNFVTTTKEKPTIPWGGAVGLPNNQYNSHTPPLWMVYQNQNYRLYNAGSAEVTFVLGEFYWRVQVGGSCAMQDYICPPHMLSREADGNEIVWSISEYLQPEAIKQAFGLAPMPPPAGIAPNQPLGATSDWGRIRALWLLFSVFLTMFFFISASQSPGRQVSTNSVPFVHNGKKNDQTLPTFAVPYDHGILKVEIDVPQLNNDWVYVSGEIVNDNDGTSYPFEREISYYSGHDSDGAWTEGSLNASFLVSSVPKGNYYINIDTESGAFRDSNTDSFQLIVTRNPITFANYFWCLTFLSGFPLLCWTSARSMEVKRWSNSDYSPYQSSS